MKNTGLYKLSILIIALSLFSCKENVAPQTTKDNSTITAVDENIVKDNHATEPETTADPVTAIKKEFARINAANLDKKSYTYQCDELMTIDYYYEGDDVVKAVVDYGTVGDHYQKSEFYYADGKLIFFYDFVEGGPACEGCEMKLEQRYYVKDDLVIKYIKNQTDEKCEICNFSQRSAPYRTLKAAKTQDFKTAFCS